ncbi:MAG: DUF1295 domain-containing protein [Bacteroidetes bacterium]|nr:DUF1295 domain-containing protein [Bacteroidota bacterium]
MALLEEFEQSGNWLFRYRTYLPLVLVALAVLVIFFDPSPVFSHQDPVFTGICIGLSLFGLIIRAITIGYVPRLTSGRNTKKQVANYLNTEGIYSTVRHPLYVGNFFMWIGIVLFSGNIWFTVAVILAYWLYYERIMFAEEQFLRGKFGQTYLAWANHTPPFIPNLSKWKGPDMDFSWRTVIKREDNGFLGMVVAFAFVDLLRNLKDGEKYLLSDFWMYTLGSSVVIYLITRTLRKTTSLLNAERKPSA